MAVIRIVDFGGLVPRLDARMLPAGAAQTASNLAQGTPEFRPVPAATTVVAASGVTNPLTIYRLQRKADGAFNTDFTSASTWKINAAYVNYVRGQNNGDETERTYLSFNDGSAAPRVIDATGSDRQLGVPKPGGEPGVLVNAADEFTDEDRAYQINHIAEYIRNTAKAFFLTPVWRGADRPGTGTSGYMDRDTVPGIDPEEGQQLRVFRYSSTGGALGGTVSNLYTGAPGSFDWMFSIDGFWKTATASWPSWAGTTNDHWCIPFHAYGLTYDINEVSLLGTLEGMEKPGADAGTKLLTPAQAAAIKDAVVEMSTNQWTDVQPKINALRAKYTQVKTLLDGGTNSTQKAAITAFYARSDVTAIFTAAVEEAANAIYAAADAVKFQPDIP